MPARITRMYEINVLMSQLLTKATVQQITVLGCKFNDDNQ